MTSHPVACDLTVVIPTVGRQLVQGCLESIAANDTWPAEVVVVDQGRGAAVGDAVARLQRLGLNVLHIRSNQVGIAAGTNRGIEHSTTAYIAVTHDDCHVAPDWVRTFAECLPGVGQALVTGRVAPEGDGANPTIMTSMTSRIYRAPQHDTDVLFPPNMGFPVSVVQRIGSLDEHPSLRFAGEDNEWAHRALRCGIPIIYEPKLLVHHVAWRSAEELPTILTGYARGQGAFYAKYLLQGDMTIVRRALHDLARAPWLLVRGIVTRNATLIAMGRGELFGLLPGLYAGMRGRRPWRS